MKNAAFLIIFLISFFSASAQTDGLYSASTVNYVNNSGNTDCQCDVKVCLDVCWGENDGNGHCTPGTELCNIDCKVLKGGNSNNYQPLQVFFSGANPVICSSKIVISGSGFYCELPFPLTPGTNYSLTGCKCNGNSACPNFIIQYNGNGDFTVKL